MSDPDEPTARTDGAGGTAGSGPTTAHSLFRRVNVGSWLFRAGVATVFTFLLAPIVVVAVTSFGDSGVLSIPPETFSTRWYESFLDSSRWQRATRNSLIAAVGTTVLATVAGTTAALGVRNLGERTEGAVLGLAVLPLLVPGVVLGS